MNFTVPEQPVRLSRRKFYAFFDLKSILGRVRDGAFSLDPNGTDLLIPWVANAEPGVPRNVGDGIDQYEVPPRRLPSNEAHHRFAFGDTRNYVIG